jgi:cellulose biosynthesis protein BcsQ
MTTIRFNDALRIAAEIANDESLPANPPVRIVRDIYGKLRFAVDAQRPIELADDGDDVVQSIRYPIEAHEVLMAGATRLGAFTTGQQVIYRDDFSNPQIVFGSPDWHRTVMSLGRDEEGNPLDEVSVEVLDRQVIGQDWLRPPSQISMHPHRVVFFGLKGGVGRSTALCMVAWGLARQGKRVLLIDFDLESPGLSGLVLPQDQVAEFGLVDWFVEDAVGQGDSVLPAMVSASPLGTTTTGAIRVVAAMGNQEPDYLAKLARVYADVSATSGPRRIGDRMRHVVEMLESQERPDVVLIDSRAGLHDLAAVSITRLADTALLFVTDSAQSWAGYRQLFGHWQRRPDIVTHVRERLALVRAMTPKSDREGRIRHFQRRAYELFAETLYDYIPAEPVSAEAEPFHPSETDEAAPHFPILVDWDERFQEFDPHLRPENGGVTEAQIDATFGRLITWTAERVSGDQV